MTEQSLGSNDNRHDQLRQLPLEDQDPKKDKHVILSGTTADRIERRREQNRRAQRNYRERRKKEKEALRCPSATQDKLAQQTLEVEAEEQATGVAPVWQRVYRLMRCPGPPCHLGPHCWIDGVGKRHYKLRTHHLEDLIKHVQQGGALEGHDDVPEEIREQLYAEEQQASERQRKRRAPSLTGFPPINITKVLPGQSPRAAQAAQASQLGNPSARGRQPASVGTVAAKASTLEIPEPLDLAVQRYTDWQCSRFSTLDVKREYQKACDLTLTEGLDLELVYEDQNVEFFTTKGVKSGVARRFVRDITAWVKKSGARM